ncbi:MAG: nuclear transport factor 2 family protein [Ostreibacterium sp.]
MTTETKDQITVEALQAFGGAWNAHDIDAILELVTNDCTFYTAAGEGLQGNCFIGKEKLREVFPQVWETSPDVQWNDPNIFVAGDRAVIESTFCATKPDGNRIEVRMVDVFTVENGKIKVKNAFRKDRPAIKS